MPRKPRFYLLGIPVQVVQRGHSREAVFYEDGDYRAYIGWLLEGAERYHCAIHAYVLMTCCWSSNARHSCSVYKA